MEHRHSDTIHPNIHELETTRWNALKKESTISLIWRIAEDSDTLALHVFHETRTLFYCSGRWVRLAEFVRAMKDGSIRREKEDKFTQSYMSEVSDNAYDLTLAKFRNIPSRNLKPVKADKNASDNKRFTWNVDCRKYFKQLLINIDKELSENPITSEANIEEEVSRITTKFVIGHFNKSMKECKRRDTTSTRYAWEVGGRKIYLFRPSYLTAEQLRKWLEDHITDVNPDAPHEKDRIQAIIDNKYPCGANIRTDDLEVFNESGREDESWIVKEFSRNTDVLTDDQEIADELKIEGKPPIEYEEGNEFTDRLSDYVAKEKSENLENLRPAIGSLGKEGVYNLVKRIFTDMVDGQYNLSEVARNFNLSKATMSRFAGSDWRKDEDMKQLSKADIPDLWINTTRVLAGNPTLMETVRSSGFGGYIDDILTIVGPKEGQKNERQ
ncbi:MAG: hypothetical protein M1418_06120 [Deltaproteobacteria bacterium]|nr:hypothetical protein [Deltaproteobacteria bacterium]